MNIARKVSNEVNWLCVVLLMCVSEIRCALIVGVGVEPLFVHNSRHISVREILETFFCCEPVDHNIEIPRIVFTVTILCVGFFL